MAIIWMDGFDHYGTTVSNAFLNDRYSGNFQSLSSGWDGTGKCVNMQYGHSLTTYLYSDQTTVVVGVRIKAVDDNFTNFIQIADSSGNRHCSISRTSTSDYISLLDSTGTNKGSSASGSFLANTWYYVELKLVLNTSAEVRLNGQSVISDATGDYQYGSGDISRVIFYDSAFSVIQVDDLCISNGDFLGDVLIKTYYPDTDATHGDFEPSTGSDHFEVVNESTPSDSDYLTGSGENDKETFTTTPSLDGPVKAVMVVSRVKKDGSLGAKFKNMVRVGGSDYLNSVETYLSGSYQYIASMPWSNNPDTSSPWTISEAEGVEFGLAITGLSTTTTTTTTTV